MDVVTTSRGGDEYLGREGHPARADHSSAIARLDVTSKMNRESHSGATKSANASLFSASTDHTFQHSLWDCTRAAMFDREGIPSEIASVHPGSNPEHFGPDHSRPSFGLGDAIRRKG